MDDKHSGSRSKTFQIQPSACNKTNLPRERDDDNRRFTWIWIRESFTLHQIKAANSNVSPRRGPNFHTKQVTQPKSYNGICLTFTPTQGLWFKIIRAGHHKGLNTVAAKIPSNSLTRPFVVILSTSPTWWCFGDILKTLQAGFNSYVFLSKLQTNLPKLKYANPYNFRHRRDLVQEISQPCY